MTDVWWLSPKFFTANIIFGIYLGFICFRPEIQSFFCKKQQPNTQNYGQGTHRAKIGTLVYGRKYRKSPYIFWPNLSAQAQTFGIFEKTTHSGCPSMIGMIFGIDNILILATKSLGTLNFCDRGNTLLFHGRLQPR